MIQRLRDFLERWREILRGEAADWWRIYGKRRVNAILILDQSGRTQTATILGLQGLSLLCRWGDGPAMTTRLVDLQRQSVDYEATRTAIVQRLKRPIRLRDEQGRRVPY